MRKDKKERERRQNEGKQLLTVVYVNGFNASSLFYSWSIAWYKVY